MLSERITGTPFCDLARRWSLHPRFARDLLDLDARASFTPALAGVRGWGGLYIISGFRPASLQTRINPLAPDSRHTECPALAADLRVGGVPASLTPEETWEILGRIWKGMGTSNRWGGDFRSGEPGFGLNHFDQGPTPIQVPKIPRPRL